MIKKNKKNQDKFIVKNNCNNKNAANPKILTLKTKGLSYLRRFALLSKLTLLSMPAVVGSTGIGIGFNLFNANQIYAAATIVSDQTLDITFNGNDYQAQQVVLRGQQGQLNILEYDYAYNYTFTASGIMIQANLLEQLNYQGNSPKIQSTGIFSDNTYLISMPDNSQIYSSMSFNGVDPNALNNSANLPNSSLITNFTTNNIFNLTQKKQIAGIYFSSLNAATGQGNAYNIQNIENKINIGLGNNLDFNNSIYAIYFDNSAVGSNYNIININNIINFQNLNYDAALPNINIGGIYVYDPALNNVNIGESVGNFNNIINSSGTIKTGIIYGVSGGIYGQNSFGSFNNDIIINNLLPDSANSLITKIMGTYGGIYHFSVNNNISINGNVGSLTHGKFEISANADRITDTNYPNLISTPSIFMQSVNNTLTINGPVIGGKFFTDNSNAVYKGNITNKIIFNNTVKNTNANNPLQIKGFENNRDYTKQDVNYSSILVEVLYNGTLNPTGAQVLDIDVIKINPYPTNLDLTSQNAQNIKTRNDLLVTNLTNIRTFNALNGSLRYMSQAPNPNARGVIEFTSNSYDINKLSLVKVINNISANTTSGNGIVIDTNLITGEINTQNQIITTSNVGAYLENNIVVSGFPLYADIITNNSVQFIDIAGTFKAFGKINLQSKYLTVRNGIETTTSIIQNTYLPNNDIILRDIKELTVYKNITNNYAILSKEGKIEITNKNTDQNDINIILGNIKAKNSIKFNSIYQNTALSKNIIGQLASVANNKPRIQSNIISETNILEMYGLENIVVGNITTNPAINLDGTFLENLIGYDNSTNMIGQRITLNVNNTVYAPAFKSTVTLNSSNLIINGTKNIIVADINTNGLISIKNPTISDLNQETYYAGNMIALGENIILNAFNTFQIEAGSNITAKTINIQTRKELKEIKDLNNTNNYVNLNAVLSVNDLNNAESLISTLQNYSFFIDVAGSYSTPEIEKINFNGPWKYLSSGSALDVNFTDINIQNKDYTDMAGGTIANPYRTVGLLKIENTKIATFIAQNENSNIENLHFLANFNSTDSQLKLNTTAQKFLTINHLYTNLVDNFNTTTPIQIQGNISLGYTINDVTPGALNSPSLNFHYNNNNNTPTNLTLHIKDIAPIKLTNNELTVTKLVGSSPDYMNSLTLEAKAASEIKLQNTINSSTSGISTVNFTFIDQTNNNPKVIFDTVSSYKTDAIMPLANNRYWLEINDITKFSVINSNKIALGSNTQKWKKITINATENDAKNKFDIFSDTIVYTTTPLITDIINSLTTYNANHTFVNDTIIENTRFTIDPYTLTLNKNLTINGTSAGSATTNTELDANIARIALDPIGQSNNVIIIYLDGPDHKLNFNHSFLPTDNKIPVYQATVINGAEAQIHNSIIESILNLSSNITKEANILLYNSSVTNAVTIGNKGVLTLDATSRLNEITTVNGGKLILNGDATLNGNTIINQGGLLSLVSSNTFQNVNQLLTINAGGSLSLSGTSTMNRSSDLTIDRGNLTLSDSSKLNLDTNDLTLTSAITSLSGTSKITAGVTNITGGSLTLNNTATLNLDINDLTLTSGVITTLNNQASITAGATNITGGSLTLSDTANLNLSNNTLTLTSGVITTLNNQASITAGATNITGGSLTLNNTATLNLDINDLTLNGVTTLLNGTSNINANEIKVISGILTSNSTVSIIPKIVLSKDTTGAILNLKQGASAANVDATDSTVNLNQTATLPNTDTKITTGKFNNSIVNLDRSASITTAIFNTGSIAILKNNSSIINGTFINSISTLSNLSNIITGAFNNSEVNLDSTSNIIKGTFTNNSKVNLDNNSSIKTGTFANSLIILENFSGITTGTFTNSSTILDNDSNIETGTFDNGIVTLNQGSSIDNAIFTNNSKITLDQGSNIITGTFDNSTVNLDNNSSIKTGTFDNSTVNLDNNSSIKTGTFNNSALTLNNNSSIAKFTDNPTFSSLTLNGSSLEAKNSDGNNMQIVVNNDTNITNGILTLNLASQLQGATIVNANSIINANNGSKLIGTTTTINAGSINLNTNSELTGITSINTNGILNLNSRSLAKNVIATNSNINLNNSTISNATLLNESKIILNSSSRAENIIIDKSSLIINNSTIANLSISSKSSINFLDATSYIENVNIPNVIDATAYITINFDNNTNPELSTDKNRARLGNIITNGKIFNITITGGNPLKNSANLTADSRNIRYLIANHVDNHKTDITSANYKDLFKNFNLEITSNSILFDAFHQIDVNNGHHYIAFVPNLGKALYQELINVKAIINDGTISEPVVVPKPLSNSEAIAILLSNNNLNNLQINSSSKINLLTSNQVINNIEVINKIPEVSTETFNNIVTANSEYGANLMDIVGFTFTNDGSTISSSTTIDSASMLEDSLPRVNLDVVSDAIGAGIVNGKGIQEQKTNEILKDIKSDIINGSNEDISDNSNSSYYNDVISSSGDNQKDKVKRNMLLQTFIGTGKTDKDSNIMPNNKIFYGGTIFYTNVISGNLYGSVGGCFSYIKTNYQTGKKQNDVSTLKSIAALGAITYIPNNKFYAILSFTASKAFGTYERIIIDQEIPNKDIPTKAVADMGYLGLDFDLLTSLKFKFSNGFTLLPQAGISYNHMFFDKTIENGILNLKFTKRDIGNLSGYLGLRTDIEKNNMLYTFDIGATYNITKLSKEKLAYLVDKNGRLRS
ncbi:MAG: autotransporter domain-containing protein [Rickettsiales bacterium]